MLFSLTLTCFVLNYIITLHWSFSHYGMNKVRIAHLMKTVHIFGMVVVICESWIQFLFQCLLFWIFCHLVLFVYLLQYLDVLLALFGAKGWWDRQILPGMTVFFFVQLELFQNYSEFYSLRKRRLHPVMPSWHLDFVTLSC